MELEQFNHTIIPLRPKIMAAAIKMTGDRDAAEDLVQETMLRLWSIRSTLDSHPNPEALSIAILKNKQRDEWRHRQLETGNGVRAAVMVAEECQAERFGEMETIRMIVDRLPPLQSKIFRMKEIEGYEAEEIIQITGCSAESLRQHLSRARKRIREEFLKMTMTRR
ncbi:MAG: RNA polymerase sigma factor [Prevotellaceae bacterium]|nr:RNA polymerase sigma factor [Prevotella sp.]MDD7257935.1 RNA polymerase sigma factor [Prevotellaceae bacterium]MDY6129846.1 RNA polymerase sigma factor [Prevotella sp.]